MQNQTFRIDVGCWTLSRSNGHPHFELEPDPHVFEPIDTPDEPEPVPEPIADRAAAFRHLLASGEVRNRADLARRFGISHARVTQVLGPMNQNKKGG